VWRVACGVWRVAECYTLGVVRGQEALHERLEGRQRAPALPQFGASSAAPSGADVLRLVPFEAWADKTAPFDMGPSSLASFDIAPSLASFDMAPSLASFDMAPSLASFDIAPSLPLLDVAASSLPPFSVAPSRPLAPPVDGRAASGKPCAVQRHPPYSFPFGKHFRSPAQFKGPTQGRTEPGVQGPFLAPSSPLPVMSSPPQAVNRAPVATKAANNKCAGCARIPAIPRPPDAEPDLCRRSGAPSIGGGWLTTPTGSPPIVRQALVGAQNDPRHVVGMQMRIDCAASPRDALQLAPVPQSASAVHVLEQKSPNVPFVNVARQNDAESVHSLPPLVQYFPISSSFPGSPAAAQGGPASVGPASAPTNLSRPTSMSRAPGRFGQ